MSARAYLRSARTMFKEMVLRKRPNLRGVLTFPPGHFYSPLLDIKSLAAHEAALPFDGADWWEHVDMRLDEQRAYYQELVDGSPAAPFPSHKSERCRYYSVNNWFPWSDAFTLAGVMRKEKPRRIIEVGSGYSSAVMLDTLESSGLSTDLTFIEPYPARLYSLLTSNDKRTAVIHEKQVQQVPLAVFDELDEHDLLFIDSSHVLKVGSDLSFIMLRVMPRLKPGVIVHFHDIFYPCSYPANWIREGRAWNESLALRAMLVGGSMFRVLAFNAFAGESFPEIFSGRFPEFLQNTGGSLWLKKIAS